MNKYTFLGLILLASIAAPAASLTCGPEGATAGTNYRIKFNSDFSSARVSVLQNGQTVAVSLLDCRKRENTVPAGAGDQMIVVAECSEPNLRDAGFQIQLSTGGFAGQTTAELIEDSFIGSRTVARMICAD